MISAPSPLHRRHLRVRQCMSALSTISQRHLDSRLSFSIIAKLFVSCLFGAFNILDFGHVRLFDSRLPFGIKVSVPASESDDVCTSATAFLHSVRAFQHAMRYDKWLWHNVISRLMTKGQDVAYTTDVFRSQYVHVCMAAPVFRLFVSQNMVAGEVLMGLYSIDYNDLHHLIQTFNNALGSVLCCLWTIVVTNTSSQLMIYVPSHRRDFSQCYTE